MASDYVIVLTTLPIDQDGDRFAELLVRDKLAACVNVLPSMRSTYAWQGAIESAEERQVIIKTTVGRVPELEARVKALHPYDLPEFLVLSIASGSLEYLSWLSDSTK